MSSPVVYGYQVSTNLKSNPFLSDLLVGHAYLNNSATYVTYFTNTTASAVYAMRCYDEYENEIAEICWGWEVSVKNLGEPLKYYVDSSCDNWYSLQTGF